VRCCSELELKRAFFLDPPVVKGLVNFATCVYIIRPFKSRGRMHIFNEEIESEREELSRESRKCAEKYQLVIVGLKLGVCIIPLHISNFLNYSRWQISNDGSVITICIRLLLLIINVIVPCHNI
jgi:hypothetical protein